MKTIDASKVSRIKSIKVYLIDKVGESIQPITLIIKRVHGI